MAEWDFAAQNTAGTGTWPDGFAESWRQLLLRLAVMSTLVAGVDATGVKIDKTSIAARDLRRVVETNATSAGVARLIGTEDLGLWT